MTLLYIILTLVPLKRIILTIMLALFMEYMEDNLNRIL